jgi:hypothetical protein
MLLLRLLFELCLPQVLSSEAMRGQAITYQAIGPSIKPGCCTGTLVAGEGEGSFSIE